MARPRLVLTQDMPVGDALQALERIGLAGAPVLDEAGRFAGTVARNALAALDETDHLRSLSHLVDAGAPTVPSSSRLDLALDALTAAHLSWVPVLDDDRGVVGTLSISDLVHAYRQELLASMERLGELGAGAGTFEARITDDSPLAGRALRVAGLPRGVLVTSITRGPEIMVPSGDTVILAGDRLSLLGQHDGVDRIGEVTSMSSGSR